MFNYFDFMKLKQLIHKDDKIEIRGKKDIDILGLSSDSRTVAPGFLFFAVKGNKFDGNDFIYQAASNGAKAIVTQVYDPFLPLTQIVTPHPEKWIAIFASRFYQKPADKLFCVGVTGSKGKTTTSYLCKHLLDKIDQNAGLISTIETWIQDDRKESNCTTKDAITNQKLLYEMAQKKLNAAVLEVSSHGLMQSRVDEISFDIAIFTNLHPDHLDYHQTIGQYAEAKKRLFDKVEDSIINNDSPWGGFMKSKGRVITYGILEKADLQATDIQACEAGVSFLVNGVFFKIPLFGTYNVYNVLAALALGVYRGRTLESMQHIFDDFCQIPGRFEKIPNAKNIQVIVDYAHTGESLSQVLSIIKSIAKKKVYVVFGCGGERDPFRRQTMALAAEKFADFSIVTTDNPRSESAENICQEILKGFQNVENVKMILDRKLAIAEALSMAQENDYVLIAGKGHEKVQVYSHQTFKFDDAAIAQEFLQ